jgi:hypothetical protein
MKNLIVCLGLTVFATSTFACSVSIPESYVPTFLNPPVMGHYAKCESAPEEKCHCVDAVNPYISELVDNIVLDYVAKLEVESCTKAEFNEAQPEANLYADCDAKFAAKSCAEGTAINNYDLLEVYCAKDVMKLDGKKLVENAAKKAAYEAAQAAKAAQEAAMEIASKSQECGKTTLALMLVRNASKGLSNAQKVQLVESTDMISKLLQLGSLDAAKGLIQSATADGTIITEGDKTALAAHIDGCKP